MNQLRTISRLPLHQLNNVNVIKSVATRSASNIAGGSMGKAWADKEHAAETAYFNKKDAETLASLAKKLHLQTTPDETAMASAKTEIMEICQKHGVQVPDAFLDDLVKYKFNH